MDSTPATRPRGVRRLFTPITLSLVICVLSLTLIGVFGGWEPVAQERDRVVTILPGETVTAHPFAVTPVAAYWTTLKDAPYLTPAGKRLLVVELELQVQETFPVPAILLTGDTTLEAPGIETRGTDPTTARQRLYGSFRTLDTHTPWYLQPGLRHPITALWAQDLSVPAPETLTLTFPSFTWRQHSGGLGHDWFDPTPAARVTLPVTERTTP
ncbi:MAG: hypothetical protein Q4D89_13415 [Arachnia propionica]|uniref:hypothetical protein n=1 Tax=Arachnia propionica TaxID=1750 RepID=UPI0026F5783F|nr:hypothetical protein [Arachnia propionica]